MAVNALELRPKNAIALFDAAIRVCATTGGVWAITLPASAGLIAALFNLGLAMQRHESLLAPVSFWTLAWAVRAVSQGAACYHLERQILATEPSVRRSFRAALERAPGLITASMSMLVLNTAIIALSLGVGFFFFGAHAAGYAAVMHGRGSALDVYGTAARLLGAARSSAPWVRLCGLTQLFVGLNLFLAVAAALYVVRALFGFDVSFLQRFTAHDNGVWVATVAAVTFVLFEPVRAAAGTLLLIDGRVRQEGLDLLAAAEQLPRRRKKGLPAGAVGLMTLMALLLALPALGQSPSERLEAISQACSMTVDQADLEPTRFLDERDQQALARFVTRIEHTVWDEEDCEEAEATLRAGLALMATPSNAPEPAFDPAALARATLARPEFAATPAGEATLATQEPDASHWWDALWRALWEWVEKNKGRPLETPSPSSGHPMAAANAVMIAAVVVIAALLGYLLLKGRAPKKHEITVDESGTVSEVAQVDPASALARPADRWAGLADELAARGSFREAIRHLYLALLARLHHDGAIDYDPTRSNWDYLSTFKGPSPARSAFRDLTRRFDFAWYGNLDVTSEAWLAFRLGAEPLLAAPSLEASHG